MRIGLLGAGHMGRLHVGALRRIDGVEVAAVAGASADSRSADRLAKACGLGTPRSIEAILDDASIDVVVVTTPTATHRAIVCRALEAGKHVICETPLAPTVDDAVAMASAASEAVGQLQVALLGRFANPGSWAKRMIEDGAVGTPRVVRVARMAPATTGTHHGDAIEEILLFELDWLCWTLGEPGGVRADVLRGAGGQIDHVVARIRFGDTLAVAEGSYLLPGGLPIVVHTHIIGSQGVLDGCVTISDRSPPATRLTLSLPDVDPETQTSPGGNPIEAEDRHAIAVFRGEADPTLLHPHAACTALRLAARVRDALDPP